MIYPLDFSSCNKLVTDSGICRWLIGGYCIQRTSESETSLLYEIHMLDLTASTVQINDQGDSVDQLLVF